MVTLAVVEEVVDAKVIGAVDDVTEVVESEVVVVGGLVAAATVENIELF